jgi:hypothetical protein
MRNLSFWAQSLDNQAPDVIFKDGEKLSDDGARQKLVSEIYEIPKGSIEVVPANATITIRYSYPKFVIEAIPFEKDQANRLAPIIIYGVFPEKFSQLWVKDVCSEIETFVSSTLKRTLDNSSLTAINDWLYETLKKKTRKSQLSLFGLIKIPLIRLVNWLKLMVRELPRGS